MSASDARKRLAKQHPAPSIALLIAALLILVSAFFPYWKMSLEAPQYPDGLTVEIFVTKVTGDVDEVDRLNHYIGMRTLDEAGRVERSIGTFAISILACAVAGAALVHNRWVLLFTIPALTYPFIFLGDLYFWLRLFGQNLDPTAALSSSVQPFITPLAGSKDIANFTVSTGISTGFYLVLFAWLIILLGLFLHREAYRPLLKFLN